MQSSIRRARGVDYLTFGRVMDELPYRKDGSRLYRGPHGTETKRPASVTELELYHSRGCSASVLSTSAPTRGITKYRALAEPLASHVRGAVTARAAPSAMRPGGPRHITATSFASTVARVSVTCSDISGLRNFVSLIFS
jgi:hypothetical protein